jgi:predicted methyltransferase
MSLTSRLCLALAAIGLTSAPALIRDTRPAPPPAHGADECVPVSTKASLLHMGSLDSFGITEGGTEAAKALLDCIEHNDPDRARHALMVYDRIILKENFGGEYTALQWLCEYLVASTAQKELMLADPYVASFYQLLSADNYDALKAYLRQKYHLSKTSPQDKDKDEAGRRQRFLEDFVLFNNPRRETWEKSSLIVQAVGLKPGDVVADFGCGPGYFSFRFAEKVGNAGLVYAIDSNDRHLRYVTELARKNEVGNVRPVAPRVGGDINLPQGAKIDKLFMCSVYHVLYGSMSQSERETLFASIKRHLKSDGTLVIVDNAPVEDRMLPYHGPYIAKELIIGQMKHFGFTLAGAHQYIPQRYVLLFKLSGTVPAGSTGAAACTRDGCIPIRSPLSFVEFNTNLATFMPGGREAARVFFRAIGGRDRADALEALRLYRDLIKKERYGDEYSAFAWYCEYLLAEPEERKHFLDDKYVADYHRFLGGDDLSILKKYVWNKYRLALSDDEIKEGSGIVPPRLSSEINQDQLLHWSTFIALKNPRREEWEKTSQILEFLRLKPGSSVADVGCGPGYYTHKFSDKVGEDGLVYAVDTDTEQLDYVAGSASRHGVRNIRPVRAHLNDTKLPPDCADVVFLCSLYNGLYVSSLESVRDEFIASIKKALRKGGRLVIVDNDILPEDQVPYIGPRIDRRLIIQQLEHYGFRLVDTAQFVPQRYVLVFRLGPTDRHR